MKGSHGNAQSIADSVDQWSHNNRVQFNSEKFKLLRISLTNDTPECSILCCCQKCDTAWGCNNQQPSME